MLTSIGGRAFSAHSDLVSVVIPDSVTSIGEKSTFVFDACRKLGMIQAPGVSFTELNVKTDYKLAMVQGFISNPSVYSEAEKEAYKKYLNSQKKKLLSQAVAANNIDALAVYEQLEIKIPPVQRDELIEQAKQEKKKALSWLMDYKTRTEDRKQEAAEKDRSEKQLLANPYMAKFLKAEWGWSKLEDGTMQIDKYRGNDTQITVPPFVGKVPVFTMKNGQKI